MFSLQMLGVWIAALMTLFIFSFLYRDNPFYKFAEHLFVGTAAGYGVALEYHNVVLPNLIRPLVRGEGVVLSERLLLLVPLVLGLLLFTRFSNRLSAFSRWPIAVMVGAYSGLAIIGAAQGDLVAQIQANLVPLFSPEAGTALVRHPGLFSLLEFLANPLIVMGLLFTLVYFFFSTEHKGPIGGLAKVGIWFLMVSFGASFGYTVMARVSLLIGRVHFLLSDWLHIIR
jgi:hypothetical protein